MACYIGIIRGNDSPSRLESLKGEKAVDHALGPAKDTDLALGAWRRAKKTLKPCGRQIEDVIIQNDQDGVYIGHRWLSEIVLKSKARVS